jgi:hypothetical protein
LADEETAEVKKFDVSLLYAESMLRELGLIVTEWQATIDGFRQAELDRTLAATVGMPPTREEPGWKSRGVVQPGPWVNRDQ